jgi:hypothetical protein
MCLLTDPKGNIYIFVNYPLIKNRGLDINLMPRKVENLKNTKIFFDLFILPNINYKKIIRLLYKK